MRVMCIMLYSIYYTCLVRSRTNDTEITLGCKNQTRAGFKTELLYYRLSATVNKTVLLTNHSCALTAEDQISVLWEKACY